MANVIYWVDSKDTIVDVGGDWSSAAEEQGCFSLDTAEVVGKSLFDYIQGDATVMFMTTMLKRVRLKQDSIERDYRCDTPDTRRHMKMTITYEADERIKISHIEVASEKRKEVCEFNTVVRGADLERITTPYKRCSMCGRIYDGSQWLEADTDFPDQNRFNVFYGICPDCANGRWQNSDFS